MSKYIQKIDITMFVDKHGLSEIPKIDEMIIRKLNELIEAWNAEFYEEVEL